MGAKTEERRVSNARIDVLSGGFVALGSGVSGMFAAWLNGTLSPAYAVLAFVAGAGYSVIKGVRRWHESETAKDEPEPLPESTTIRPNWLVPAWQLIYAPIFFGLCIATGLWSPRGVVSAGVFAGISVWPFMEWLHLRRWEREHAATVYYERTPLMSGGVSARYFIPSKP